MPAAAALPWLRRTAALVGTLLAVVPTGFAAAQGGAPPDAGARGMPVLSDPDFAAEWRRHVGPDGESNDDPDAWLAAARAALAVVFYRLAEDDPQLTLWLDRAYQATERALALRPEDPYGWLLQAQALGERALQQRRLDPFLPGALRSRLQRAEAAAPHAPDVQIATGLLHLELVKQGVGWLYGGRLDEGLARLEAGLRLAPPERLDLRLMAGRMLLEIGRKEQGLAVLTDAAEIAARQQPWDAFQREVVREVAALLRTLLP